jgi:hypothetical protein
MKIINKNKQNVNYVKYIINRDHLTNEAKGELKRQTA